MARSIPLLVLVALLAALAHAEEKAREPADVMRALLLRRADVLVDASQARLGVLEADLREASSRWEMGVADDATVVVAREAVLEARMALARAKLEREEVRLTGQPPSDDPAAPMAGDRDLVHERLQLDHEESHLRLRALRTRLKLLEGRRAAAGIGEQELAATRLDVEIEKRRLESVENRIALRTSFREGEDHRRGDPPGRGAGTRPASRSTWPRSAGTRGVGSWIGPVSSAGPASSEPGISGPRSWISTRRRRTSGWPRSTWSCWS
jgi:hypothetical protein